jgi:hypothetical protein
VKAQDKQRPVPLAVKVHPEVLRIARALGQFYDGSDLDHIVSEAIKDASTNKKFTEWLEQHPDAGKTKEEPTQPVAKPGRKSIQEAA